MSALALFLLTMIPGTFFLGVYDISIKKILKSGIREGVLLGTTFFISGCILSIIALIVGIPEIKKEFWLAFWGTVGLNIISQSLWYKAFNREDASLISPLRLITPPLVLVTGAFALGEIPSGWGIIGVLTTVIGLGLLLKSEASFAKEKIISLVQRPGILFGAAGAILFAFSFPLDKLAVVSSSAIFFTGAFYLTVGTVHFLYDRIRFHTRTGGLRDLAAIGKQYPVMLLAHVLGGFLTIQALNYSLAAYAASLKRLWSFWAVILSGKFLGEKNVGLRLLATLIMLGGIALTVILG